jgi:hypothetical protein
MTADKFGAEYAKYKDMSIDDVALELSQCVTQNAIMSEALREAWAIFDKLGAHQSDDNRLSILHSPEFSSAAYRVRTAMLRVARQI